MKRSATEQNGNSVKRLTVNGLNNDIKNSTVHTYNQTMLQYYPVSQNNYSAMTMVPMVPSLTTYSMYNNQTGQVNWQGYSAIRSNVPAFFDPTRPPPPLPKNINPNSKVTRPSNIQNSINRANWFTGLMRQRCPTPTKQISPNRTSDIKSWRTSHKFTSSAIIGTNNDHKLMKQVMLRKHENGLGGKQMAKTNQLIKRQTGCEVLDADEFEEPHEIQVNKKSKRKPMSTRYTRKREWNREDALKAIALEEEYRRLQRRPMLIIKFPDPELNKDIVKQYSTFIETVHFQQPSTARYCFVTLNDDADIDKVQEDLSSIKFGTGNIIVEKKRQNCETNQPVAPEEIDPYTLYVGNFPPEIAVARVKELFKNAQRVDLGFAQRLKLTRYAFIRHHTVEEAMETYKKTFNLLIDSRSLIVRFRRQRGNVGLPGEARTPNPKKLPPAQKSDVEIIPNISLDISSNIDLQDSTIYQDISNDSLKPEEIDSKENVLAEASNLLKKTFSKDGPVVREIKQEWNQNVPMSDEEDGVNTGLLGTRVKPEPREEDDVLTQQAIYYDEMVGDFDIDTGPEDEDDIIPEDENIRKESEISASLMNRYWETVRLKELNTIEKKPDINLLPPFEATQNTKHMKTVENEVSNEPDLDEIFRSMNPECDENDQYEDF